MSIVVSGEAGESSERLAEAFAHEGGNSGAGAVGP